MRSFHHCCAPVIFLAASLPHLAVAQYSVLNSFSPVAPEAYPKCTLVEISPGVFLGSNSQEVFRITSAGVLEDVVNFANNRAYNYVLPGALAPSSDGRYYGVEYSINPGNEGEIFYISAAGTAPVIARGPLKNVFPMTEAADGDLYGTVAAGPRGFALFKLTLGGTMTDLTGGLTGEFGGPPLQASDGNFYGVSSFTTARLSAVYRITPSGELKVLYTLPSGETGAGPLMQATNGLIYGTAVFDPQPSCSADTPVGEIFSVSLSGQYQTVQTLTGCNASTINGTIAGPQAGLLEASDGYLYGSTVASGADGYGTIFRLLPDGSGLENVFAFDHASGSAPQTYGPAVVQGSDGVLYGSAAFGGSNQGGVVFRLDLGLTPPLPNVPLFHPQTGAVGARVRLAGDHLIGLTGVSFNGVPAKFLELNVKYAYAIVPAGATTGPITVTTMNGSYTTAANFTIQ